MGEGQGDRLQWEVMGDRLPLEVMEGPPWGVGVVLVGGPLRVVVVALRMVALKMVARQQSPLEGWGLLTLGVPPGLILGLVAPDMSGKVLELPLMVVSGVVVSFQFDH